ncbi:hypothetical protein HOE37_05835 [Candidatus Woesearchaeota archaeon]|jgi:hypothetical protein|nr:hypothetical protein [Candidatus Woesearchaeota archaeon]MBT4111354.1 hypothetical protein [Candidatus Woesearchaeota archaeon]MBT4336467.1 hypothetical protein [Candidatus Woesearchaeota archaeon]MBT4469880.1 hypothetical protein [Candidatus Woesearchaeota archaeon]MBT6744449.1 hypothetical protein [Candidatus Woesearchaeota archaeon]
MFKDLEGVINSTEIWTPLPNTDFSHIAVGTMEEVRLLKVFYDMIEFERFGKRKDGTDHLIHPLTVTHLLQKAGASFLAQSAGMLHDYVEELVDATIARGGVPEGLDVLDVLEEQMQAVLSLNLNDLFPEGGISGATPEKLISVVDLISRHKRERYYRSISRIFSCQDPEVKDATIQVKFADKIHAALTLSGFNERDKIYQCFKNVFILNNAKRYLIGTSRITDDNSEKEMDSLEKLFRKSCKTTYIGFSEILHEIQGSAVAPALPYLRLAFHKYAYKHQGLDEVSELDSNEMHPTWLSQAIIKKYDSLLHREQEDFLGRESRERDYCKSFFNRFGFDDDELESLVSYKDAFALKEVVIRLLYDPNYLVNGFGCSSMCARSNVCALEVNKA